MDLGTLFMKVVADTTQAEKSLESFKGTMSGIATTVAATAVGIGVGLLAAAKEGIDGINAMENATAQLDAVLASTGGAAGVTRDQVIGMAEAYQLNTKFAAESVVEAENLLLTFTNIGKDVFPRATQATLDMATAMGTDAAGQSIALGKALNDPTKGITALTRVGVTFTAEQKKAIKVMQESGDMAGAQTVILKELEKEFGGSAEAAGNTFAGKIEIAKNAVGELYESGASRLMPMLNKFLDWVMANMPAIEKTMNSVLDGISNAFKWVSDNADVLIPILAGVVAGFVAMKVINTAVALFSIYQSAVKAVAAAQGVMNLVMKANPFGLIVTAIGLLVAAGVLLYKNWDLVRVNVLKIFDSISFGVGTAMRMIKIKVLEGALAVVTAISKITQFIPGLGAIVEKAKKGLEGMINATKLEQDAAKAKNALNQASYAVQLQEINLKKLEKAGKDTSKASKDLTVAKKEETKAHKDNTEAQKKAKDAAEELRKATVKSLDDIGEALQDSLKAKYESELSSIEDSIEREIKAQEDATERIISEYEKRYEAKLKTLDEEERAKIEAINGQINAIDNLTEAEERAMDEAEYQKDLSEKKKEALATDSAEERAKIEAEVAEMIAEYDRNKLLEQRDAQKEALKAEIEAIKKQAEQKRAEMESELDSFKSNEEARSRAIIDGLNQRLSNTKELYKELLKEENIYNEARKLMIEKQNDEIQDLLETYNKQWKDKGQSFGESLIDGLKSTQSNLEKEIEKMLKLVKARDAIESDIQPLKDVQAYATNIAKSAEIPMAVEQSAQTQTAMQESANKSISTPNFMELAQGLFEESEAVKSTTAAEIATSTVSNNEVNINVMGAGNPSVVANSIVQLLRQQGVYA